MLTKLCSYFYKFWLTAVLATSGTCLLLVSCSFQLPGNESFASSERAELEYETRPRVVTKVWPGEQSVVTQSEFLDEDHWGGGNICVEWNAFSVVEPGDDWITKHNEVPERTRLFLNGHQLSLVLELVVPSLNIVTIEDGEARYSGPYKYCWWAGELPAGHYEGTFLVERTSGQLLGHTWQFEIRQ